ncbi:MAG TPA: tetratricopeptide repeat protein [Bryobacteraceae bacterium]|nr:tetratricopeptide repeat protein [Bryobacteraceae bacterium]
MDRTHRKELKHDKFVEQVGHTVEYAAEHRTQLTRYGLIVLAVIVIGAGYYFFRNYQHSVRQAALRDALRIQNAQVGKPGNEFFASYSTEAERSAAQEKTWKEFLAKYHGTDEGAIGAFYLATVYADRGNLNDAEKYFKQAIDDGSAPYASQAKLSLAELYNATGRRQDAERLLRELMNKPTVMVSKEQATIALARVLTSTKPEEARKLLEPLRTQSGAVSRVALTALAEMPSR